MRWMLVLALIVLVACGGDDALSDDEYIEEASSVMEPLADSLDTFSRLMGDASDREALVANDEWRDDVEDQLGIWRNSHKELEDIEPPASFEDAHDALLLATECLSDTADEVDDALEDGISGDWSTPVRMIESCTDLIRDAGDEL